MKKSFEKHWKDLLLICAYIATAVAVYTVWFQSMWHLWYVTLLTACLICVVGVLIGAYYIKEKDKEEAKKNEEVKIEETKEEIKETEKGE